MGYKHTPWALARTDLTATEKLILISLVNRADNRTRQCWPSLARIATDCGLSPNSRRTIQQATKSLSEKGLITVRPRRQADRLAQTSHMYTVHWPDGEVGAESTYLGADSTDVGAESYTNRDMNQVMNQVNLSTSNPDGSDHREELAPSTEVEAASERASRAAAADPISPEFYQSEDRKTLLTSVQHMAELKTAADPENTDSYSRLCDAVDLFENNLVTMFGQDDLLDSLIWDMSWQPPKDCTELYKAAVWLNKFLHTWNNEAGPLAWRGQHG